jgi:hypothetical protein
MSDTNTTDTSTPETPTNIVPVEFTPQEPASAINVEASAPEQTDEKASAPQQTDESLPEATEANTIDLDKITHEEVVQRLIDITKKLTFELLLNLKLHEHINLRDGANEGGAATAPEGEAAPEAPAANAEGDTVVS